MHNKEHLFHLDAQKLRTKLNIITRDAPKALNRELTKVLGALC